MSTRGEPDLLRAGIGGGYRIGALTGKATFVRHHVYDITKRWTDSDGRAQISNEKRYTTSLRIEHGDDVAVIPESTLHMSSLEEGANTSAAWAARPGAARGPFILLMDHDRNTWHTFDKPLRDRMKAWLWPALPLAWLVVTLFRLSHFSEGSNAVKGFFGICILMLLVGYYWWRNKITERRIARYHATAGEALKERLIAASRSLRAAGRKR